MRSKSLNARANTRVVSILPPVSRLRLSKGGAYHHEIDGDKIFGGLFSCIRDGQRASVQGTTRLHSAPASIHYRGRKMEQDHYFLVFVLRNVKNVFAQSYTRYSNY